MGLPTQVRVGLENNLDHESWVNCDDIQTIPRAAIDQEPVGTLTIEQEAQLRLAIKAAFDLL